MKTMGRRVMNLLIVVLLSVQAAAFAADIASPPSVQTFFRNPDILSAKLSPSGRWLGVTFASPTSRAFLGVIDLSAPKIALRPLANYSNADIRSFSWVNDQRIVFRTVNFLEGGNDQQYGPGLYSIAVEGGDIRQLIRARWETAMTTGTRIAVQGQLDPSHALYWTLEDGSDDVIVVEHRWSASGELMSLNPKRLNVVTGRTTPLSAGAPPNVRRWLFDEKGTAHVAIATNEGTSEVYWRKVADDPWKSIARFPTVTPTMTPVVADERGRLFVTTVGASGYSVFREFDFATGKPEEQALVSAPGFDVSPSTIVDSDDGRFLGIGFETDARATVWLEPAYKQLQAMVDEKFAGTVNVLTCRRCLKDGVLLVHSYSDRNPGVYHLYRASSKTWQTITTARGDIDPAQMGQLDLHRTKARDGEDLPVWVTMPAKAKPADAPRAAVVLVHGGPWVRGVTWEWNDEAQFLASRDYVVLEPEFRGSVGYGFKHFNAGFKQWGLSMQDDLDDAVKWAAAKGIVDPRRVCIMGASYGGYAALMGLVRHPATYRCGVSWLAVTDVNLMFENSWSNDASRESQLYTLPQMIGDPQKDAALLKEASPVEHAKDIRAPLLMAFGGNDRRVPLDHGRRMRDALRSAGANPQYVVYDGEGHGLLKTENRVDFYTRVEKFLAENLK